MHPPILRGHRLDLRPLTPGDVTDEYVNWLNDPEVTRFLSAGRVPSTRESVRAYVAKFQESPDDIIFAIVERETEDHIGNVTLNRIDWHDGRADTGLLIGRKDRWGRGYAGEAWSLALRYAFEDLGLRRITAGAVAGNAASLSVLKKLGFVVEGILRRHARIDDAYQDVIWLGLMREEFRSAI